MDKEYLHATGGPQPARRWSVASKIGLVLLGLGGFFFYHSLTPNSHSIHVELMSDDVCPQVAPFNASKVLRGKEIKLPSLKQSVERLSRAVQVDTGVGDNWPDPDDKPDRWTAFEKFAGLLAEDYPHIHANDSPVSREFVHKHGLLYTWPGSDSALKPLMVNSHQDVIPVENEASDEWKFPPFSGHIDYETQTVWGRGAVDCKLWLVGAMSAMDTLLDQGWTPKRTIIMSFGFDEEASGVQGAKFLGEFLFERYGPDSVAMIVDEGNPVLSASDPESFGKPIASPAVAEKGTIDVLLSLETRGGHSSMPPPHTNIAIMGQIIVLLENNPFPDLIREESSSTIHQLQCQRDAPNMPAETRKALENLEIAERELGVHNVPKSKVRFALPMTSAPQDKLEQARSALLKSVNYLTLVFLKTTQAIDIIRGGVKVNALPEHTEMMVDHRIAVYSSVKETTDHYRALLEPFAKEHKIGLDFFGEQIVPREPDGPQLNVSSYREALEPAPITPFLGEEATAYRFFSSVIRETWFLDQPRIVLHEDGHEDAPEKKYKQPITVAPSTMFGNTDTHWYQKMTKNIFRFGAMSAHEDLTGMPMIHTIHAVNEHASIDAIAKSVEFYTNLMIASDDAKIH